MGLVNCAGLFGTLYFRMTDTQISPGIGQKGRFLSSKCLVTYCNNEERHERVGLVG